MALLSQGGTTSPDIILAVILSICCGISTLLNPLVLRYNLQKKLSVPVVLFILLASLDFLTGLIVASRAIHVIVSPEMDCKDNPDVPIRVYSFVCWFLVTIPTIVVAVMAICRFIQIRFPFRVLEIRYLILFSCFIGLYNFVLNGLMCFTNQSEYNEKLLIMYNSFGFRFANFSITLVALPGIICQLTSIVTSILTVCYLYQRCKNPISEQSSRNGRRSSVKILVMNLSNIISQCIVLAVFSTITNDSKEGYRRIPRVFAFVVMPPLVSCINPVLFAAFTRGVIRFQ